MNTATKFAGFALGLAGVFTIALATGALLGPDPAEPTAHDTAGHKDTDGHGEPLGGMLATDRGYTLQLDTTQVTAAANVPLRLRILDRHGAPVTGYVRNHDKDLHLIVVRGDMVAYQHVHPVLDSEGTWSVPVDLTRAGEYRVFADFVPEGGEKLTLGAHLRVAGDYDPQPLPQATTTSTVEDYTVTMDGKVAPGQSTRVMFSVNRGGAPVTDLQPYLGAYGHLVALRAADLGYLHVHPEGHPGDGVTAAGPGITFTLTAPSAGDYRLFLDFQHEGVVRTAEFTLTVAPGTPAAGAATQNEHTGQYGPAGHSH
ncbi:hypothetical protein ACL02S_17080 [Nocardia sp. 004]|uniref:hypothetical protein n=1 Tax=Nocardia sp. 004 TaxID=3385978 RepID=UPI0039A3044E